MQHVKALEVLLQGLCGVHRERLKIHELCLKSGPNLGLVASEVQLLCDLEQPKPTWTVRHIGGAMRVAGAEQISVLARNLAESNFSKNALRLFYSLGYNWLKRQPPASSENYNEVVAAVSSFCEYLATLLHLSKPTVSTKVVHAAAAAAASLMSDGGGTTL
ncbi:mediator of RNA polymerase II transcription subunit 18 [Olea europaea subsp. europaea]|uniref:Mediator of RNA polymerase II transcription subunit 18 n=1 Tax=Olea europaea subsp. europaea TaxID=158383 RepID=A0A8S0RL27_OLEEU|nr:mediator of RNA polymerase II transcription subunit 18 [Olea europaea subsp. europaea]